MIGVLIPDYKTPELSLGIRETIRNNSSGFMDLIVAQSWDDHLLDEDILYTQTRLEMTGAINLGLSYFDVLERLHGIKFYAYWIVSSSMKLQEIDYLGPMVQFMEDTPYCVMTSPKVSGTAWDCMWSNSLSSAPRKVWGIDNIATLIRADWFNSIGRYDPDLTIGWGSALETCYLARKHGKSIWVFDSLPAQKLDGIAHSLGRREETREERNTLGSKEMHRVLGKKYGDDFLEKLGWDYR